MRPRRPSPTRGPPPPCRPIAAVPALATGAVLWVLDGPG
eukprot:gene43899-53041_t